VQHVSRPSYREFLNFALTSSRPSAQRFPSERAASSVCVQCQLRASLSSIARSSRRNGIEIPAIGSRKFTTSAQRRKEEWPKVSVTSSKPEQPESAQPNPSKPGVVNAESTETIELPPPPNSTPENPPEVPLNGSYVHPAPEEDLPSAREAQRWRLSKWFTKTMDDLMPKIAIASRTINSFTGTDYSGIEALRREIKEQGRLSSPTNRLNPS
jgi:hypothetical protein